MTLGAALFYPTVLVWFGALGVLSFRRRSLKRVGTADSIEKARQLGFIHFLCVIVPIVVGGIVVTILS